MWPFDTEWREARRRAEMARLERLIAEHQKRLDELKRWREEPCPLCFPGAAQGR